MEKQSNKKLTQLQANRILYLSVIGVLCLAAVIIGIAAAFGGDDSTPTVVVPETESEKKTETQTEAPPVSNTLPSLIAPVSGNVYAEHDLSVLVFSNTMGDWRVHAGIDILTPEGAEVFCSTDGTVSAVYDDPRLGRTVEVTHKGGIISCYSNLDKNDTLPEVGTVLAAGDRIGKVGDSSLSELADEAHLHFEIKVNGRPVNPLDYICEESKRASLGIDEV